MIGVIERGWVGVGGAGDREEPAMIGIGVEPSSEGAGDNVEENLEGAEERDDAIDRDLLTHQCSRTCVDASAGHCYSAPPDHTSKPITQSRSTLPV